MIQTVVKRDGRVVGYNEEKIKAAIRKAMLTTEAGEDEALIQRITDRIGVTGSERMTVEEIQDRVELELMKSPRKEVAKRYIAYRDQRSIARQARTRDMFLEIIEAKNNDVTRENANMNTDSPAGMMMKFASETTKPFVDDYLLGAEAKAAVRNNYIHIHDKDYYPTKSLTCVQHPLDKILEYGFVAGHGESRPAKRIETASVIACISLETAQNEMHGGQAIPAFDFYLAPYVRSSFIEEVKILESLTGRDLKHLYEVEVKDFIVRPLEGTDGEERLVRHAVNRTVGRVHQAMEAFIHNMNTIHSRGGNQVVFSSINYGTDTSAEGRCIIRELLRSTYEGVGNGATAIFPIQIWKSKSGVSYLPEDPNHDLYRLACKVSARRFFPNFLNLDATFNRHELWRARRPPALPPRGGYDGLPHPCVREPLWGEDIHRPWQPLLHHHQHSAPGSRGARHHRPGGTHTSLLRETGRGGRDYRPSASRPIYVSENGACQAVPAGDGAALERRRTAGAR